MNVNAEHAHPLDPSWGDTPVPWAPTADPTMVPRVHAACMAQCEDCLTELGHEAAKSPETTAVLMGMAMVIAKTTPAHLLPALKGQLQYSGAFMMVLDRVDAAERDGQPLSSEDLLTIMREFDEEDRFGVFDGCVQWLDLYGHVMKTQEPQEL